MKTPAVTIAITTKNRLGELRTALQSCIRQRGAVEVLVLDDGSTDGTSAMVRSEFPNVRLVTFDTSEGLIVRRNQAVRLAQAPIVLSIDDDAELTDDATTEAVLAVLRHPAVGAATIPYVDVRQGPFVKQKPPDLASLFVAASFVGTAHALKRDVFLSLGGYREALKHQGEEGDYCIRMLSAGFVVGMVDAPPIHHYESPRRSFDRMDLFGRRNDVLFAVWNVPGAWLVPHLLGTLLKGALFGVRQRRLGRMLKGEWMGLVDAHRLRGLRKAVPLYVYRLHRRLKKHGPTNIESVLAMLTIRHVPKR